MLGIVSGALSPLFTLLFADLVSTKAAQPTDSDCKANETQEVELAKKNAQFEAAKKVCRMGGGKLANYVWCVDQAKERIFNPPPPPPRKTPLQQELARCEMLGKPAQVWNCKQEAPKRLEARKQEAAEAGARASKLTPLQRALNACRGYSKAMQIWQCTQDARKKYGPSEK